jgi:hypothetical protein
MGRAREGVNTDTCAPRRAAPAPGVALLFDALVC